jgi:hypothetical protein
MKGAWSLALGALLVVGLLPVMGTLVEVTAPFAEQSSRYRGPLDRLAVPDIIMLKAGHAEGSERFEVGLFGNSRAVEVSTEDIGLSSGRFFNFAVGGTPFRQSVALIEHLDRRGRAPEVAVISVDNHALGYDGLIYWPMLMPGRFAFDRAALHDLASTALEQVKGYPVAIGARLRYLSTSLTSDNAAEPPYRLDGSRRARPGRPGAEDGFKGADVQPYYLRMIDADMARLASIARNGTRVIIYESPLHPSIARQHSGDGSRLRNHFNAACRRERIECHDAPELGGAQAWYDCCHAPPSALGSFISSQVRVKLSQ